MNNVAFSTNRLVGDNFLSGALIGLIGSGAVNLAKFSRGESDAKSAAISTLKFGLNGGIAAAYAISASNNIVRKNYVSACVDAAIGLALITITNNAIKEKR